MIYYNRYILGHTVEDFCLQRQKLSIFSEDRLCKETNKVLLRDLFLFIYLSIKQSTISLLFNRKQHRSPCYT